MAGNRPTIQSTLRYAHALEADGLVSPPNSLRLAAVYSRSMAKPDRAWPTSIANVFGNSWSRRRIRSRAQRAAAHSAEGGSWRAEQVLVLNWLIPLVMTATARLPTTRLCESERRRIRQPR